MPPPKLVAPPCNEPALAGGPGGNLTTLLDDRILDKDDLNALLYIVVTLLFYSMGIIIGIITYLKREKREIEEDKRFTDYMAMKMDPFSAYKVRNVRQVAERLKRLEEEKLAREQEEVATPNHDRNTDDAAFGDNEDNNDDDNDTPTTPLNPGCSPAVSGRDRTGLNGFTSTKVHSDSSFNDVGTDKTSVPRLSSLDSGSARLLSTMSSVSDNCSLKTESDICFTVADIQEESMDVAATRSNGVVSLGDSDSTKAEGQPGDVSASAADSEACSKGSSASSYRERGGVGKDGGALNVCRSEERLRGRGEKVDDRDNVGKDVRPKEAGTPPRSSGSPPGSRETPVRSSGTPPRSSGTPPRSMGTPPRSSGTPPRSSGTPPRRRDAEGSGSPYALPPMPHAMVRLGDSERRGGLPMSSKALHLFDRQSPPRSGLAAHGRTLVKQGTMPEPRQGMPRRVLRKQFSVSDTRRQPVFQKQDSLGSPSRPWLGSTDSKDSKATDTFDVSRV